MMSQFLALPVIFGLLFYGRFLLVWSFLSTLFVPVLIYGGVLCLLRHEPIFVVPPSSFYYLIWPAIVFCCIPVLSIMVSKVVRHIAWVRCQHELISRNNKYVSIAAMCCMQFITLLMGWMAHAETQSKVNGHIPWYQYAGYIAAFLVFARIVWWLFNKAKTLPVDKSYEQNNVLKKRHFVFMAVLVGVALLLFIGHSIDSGVYPVGFSPSGY